MREKEGAKMPHSQAILSSAAAKSITIVVALLLATMMTVALPSSSGRVDAGPAPLLLPFSPGETWYVCQGYNGQASETHNNVPALDLSVDANSPGNLSVSPGSPGRTGCAPATANASTGRSIRAPIAGTVRHVGADLVCIDSSDRSVLLGHLDNRLAVGSRVTAGQQVGAVAPPNPANGPYAHIHVQAYSAINCVSSDAIAFSEENGARFRGALDMPYIGTPGAPLGPDNPRNQYSGRALFRAVIGGANIIIQTINTPAIPIDPDIVLLIDTTTSMGSPISEIQNDLSAILSEVFDEQPAARFAVAQFKDVADFVPKFSVLQGLTSSEFSLQQAVDDLTPLSGGGSDAAEDWINALYELGGGAVNFRSESARIVVLVGDSSSHDPSNGRTLQQAIDRLTASQIRVIAVDVPTPGAISNGLDSSGQASAVVNATNGRLLDLTASSSAATTIETARLGAVGPSGVIGNVTDAILSGLQSLPVTVSAEAIGCAPYVTVTLDPPSSIVTSGESVTFTVTVEVSDSVPPGTLIQCRVDFLLDGDVITDSQIGVPIVVEIPPSLVGDANCDNSVDPLDAALILQLAAGLIEVLPCADGGDVNADGVENSLDAVLILQFSAGLLDSLPP